MCTCGKNRCREKTRISEDNRKLRLGDTKGPFSLAFGLEVLASEVSPWRLRHSSPMGLTSKVFATFCVV